MASQETHLSFSAKLVCHLLTRTLFLVAALLMPFIAAGQATIETQIGGIIQVSGLCPGGGVATGVCPADSEAYAVAVQSDGKIIAVGRSIYPLPLAPLNTARYAATVVRYTNDKGYLDPTFGSGGIVQTPIGGGDSVAHAVAIQPDGKILVGGGASPGIVIHGQSINTTPFLLRYLPDGTQDASFSVGNLGVEVDALAIQPDGSIVAVGRSSSLGEFFSIMLARFSSNGSGGGVIGSVPILPRFDCPLECPVGNPLALGPDGSIVFGGGGMVPGSGPTVVRFLPNGTPDRSFIFAGGFPGAITAVAVQPDGKIVAGGRSTEPLPSMGVQQFTLARYLQTGALDPSFGTGGIVQDPVGILVSPNTTVSDSFITALVVQPEGLIVAGGTSFSPQGPDTHQFTAIGYDPAGGRNFFTQSFYGAGADSFLGSFFLGPDRHHDTIVYAAGPVYCSFVCGHFGVTGPFVFAVEEYGGDGANTFSGTNVAVSPAVVKYKVPVPPTTVTFSNVTQDGVTTLFTSELGPTPPTTFELGTPPVYFYISTTALFTGNIQVCINYSSISLTGPPRLFHEQGGVLVDVTTSVNTVNKIICGTVTSLSPFVIAASTTQDTIPPATTASLNPLPNAAGWNNSNVAVMLTSTDNEPGGSGVKQITYSATGAQTIASTVVNGATASFTISTEGITTITFFGTDNAGNVESVKTLTIRIDRTPPTISASATPSPNANSWNNTNVTVSFACSDSLSGLAPGSPPAPTTLTSEGAGQSVTGTCTDVAGNSASATVRGINIDKTLPMVACSASPNVLWPPNNELVPVNVSVTVTDALSGPAGFTLVSVSSNEPDSGQGDIQGFVTGTASTAGQLRAQRLGSGTGRVYTFTYSGADRAGNTTSCTTIVSVPHDQGN